MVLVAANLLSQHILQAELQRPMLTPTMSSRLKPDLEVWQPESQECRKTELIPTQLPEHLRESQGMGKAGRGGGRGRRGRGLT